MKKAKTPRTIEILEQRIAPSATLTFTDVSGDTVTISSSKGTNDALSSAAHFATSGGGQVLELLSLTGNSAFKGTNLSITVTSNASGHVDIGFIDATGLDLGNVTVGGDLGGIDAGDNHFTTPAIKKLEIGSLAVEGTSTQGVNGTNTDNIAGGIKTLAIHGNLDGTLILTGGNNGTGANIGSVQIDGSVVGGSADNSGSISAAGNVPLIHVAGDVTGGMGAGSGSITVGGFINQLNVDGNIIGGTGSGSSKSGFISSNFGLTKAVIGGNIQGGDGDGSGQVASTFIKSITVGGKVIGGSGFQSGTIATSGFLGKAEVHGIVGGDGVESGVIRSTGGMGTILVDGDILGGSASQSGSIGSAGEIHFVSVVNVTGGDGDNSGEIVSQNKLDSVVVTGSLNGGGGSQSGSIGSLGTLGSVTIAGDINGGDGDESGAVLGSTTISNVVVTGDINGGFGFQSGTISSLGKLQNVTVHGSLFGSEAEFSATITSGGNMGTVMIDGDVVGSTNNQDDIVHAPGFVAQEIPFNGFSNAAIVSDGTISSVTIGGSLEGGDGDESGTIRTENPNQQTDIVKIKHQLQTVPIDNDIGTVTLGQSIIGGDGFDSGAILSNGHISSVTLGTPGATSQPGLITKATSKGSLGFLVGEFGEGSGSIFSELSIGKILITGNIDGGFGSDSGVVSTNGDLGGLTVGGSIFGGSHSYSNGQVYAQGTIQKVIVHGDVEGGNGSDSGEIRGGSIVSVVIGGGSSVISPQLKLHAASTSENGGNIFGGNGFNSGSIVSETGDISSVIIQGGISSGNGFNSGSIRSARDIGTLDIGAIDGSIGFCGGGSVNITAKGVIDPTSDAQAVAIKMITVHGNSNFADILAGVDINGDYVNANVQINTVEIDGAVQGTNIAAGASPGNDSAFGTHDDTPIGEDGANNVLSKIAKIVVGSFSSASSNQSYGFVADEVVSVNVGGHAIALQSGPNNDFVSAGDDTTINEFVQGEKQPPP